MTKQEAMSRAAGIFEQWEEKGIKPFDDTCWMNPEDRAAIIVPIAEAILLAAAPAAAPVEVPRCRHTRVSEDDDEEDGYLTCLSCGDHGTKKPCGICNQKFCRCNEWGMR